MAHAMAPNAKVILVEAKSNLLADLMVAEDVASGLVAAAGGGEVSNSWGFAEFAGQLALDTHFSTPKVVYFASTGDAPGVSWPSTSANVVAVGGTSTSRSPFTGAFLGETSWSEGGGGSSAIVPRPAYQNSIRSIVGANGAYPTSRLTLTRTRACGLPAVRLRHPRKLAHRGRNKCVVTSRGSDDEWGWPLRPQHQRRSCKQSNPQIASIRDLGHGEDFNNVVHGMWPSPQVMRPLTLADGCHLQGFFATGVGSPKGHAGL